MIIENKITINMLLSLEVVSEMIADGYELDIQDDALYVKLGGDEYNLIAGFNEIKHNLSLEGFIKKGLYEIKEEG